MLSRKSQGKDFKAILGLAIGLMMTISSFVGALAVVVAENGRQFPDLIPEDISFSDDTPMDGDLITIYANISNVGDIDAENVVVMFEDSFGGPPEVIGYYTIASIPQGETEQAYIDWIATPAGKHKIIVTVDPDDNITEIDENNNQLNAEIDVSPAGNLPDLTLTSDDITYDPLKPSEGTEVTITAVIHNDGSADASDVLVRFEDDYGGTHTIGEDTIANIPAGGTGTAEITWTAIGVGSHTITVTADPENDIEEEDEGNNWASKVIDVLEGELPDLTVANITFSDNNPTEGDVIWIYANITNIGDGSASDVVVYFEDRYGPQNTPIGYTNIAYIDGGETEQTQIEWTAEPDGRHTIFVYVDPADNITEENEDNNYATQNIDVIQGPAPDLEVTEDDISFSNDNPMVGDTITVYAVIHNIGVEPADDVYVDFLNDYGGNIEIIDTAYISTIPAGGAETAEISWNIPGDQPGNHIIRVIVDPGDIIDEQDETNNNAAKGIYVNPVPGPDLTLTSDDISFDPEEVDEGMTVEITAIIHNVGQEDTPGNVEVEFIDQPPEGPEKSIGVVTIGPILSGETGTAQINWVATPAGPHTITVVADPNNAIDEEFEDNNTASKSITVHPGGANPDLYISDDDISFDPPEQQELDNDVTIYATIYNIGEGEARDVEVYFEDNYQGGREEIDTVTIASLPAGGEVDVQVTWRETTADGQTGEHTVVVYVDKEDKIKELDETNNWGSASYNWTMPIKVDLTCVNGADDITASDYYPPLGVFITMWVNITNTGEQDAVGPGNIVIGFEDWFEGMKVQDVHPFVEFSRIDAGQTVQAQVEWTVEGSEYIGEHNFRVVIDYDNVIMESNEGNNVFERSVWWGTTGPDLTIDDHSLLTSTDTPTQNANWWIEADFKNEGTENVPDKITVALYVDGKDVEDIKATALIADGLVAGGTERVRIEWTVDVGLGIHQIYVGIDPFNTVSEQNEDNNIVEYGTIDVQPPLPDLMIEPDDITFSQNPTYIGETVFINATIHNIGSIDAENFIVDIYLDDELLASLITSIPGNSIYNHSLPFIPEEAGEFKVRVEVDTEDIISEANEYNNIAQKPELLEVLSVDKPDLEPTGITYNGSDTIDMKYKIGDTIQINITVENTGTQDVIQAFNITTRIVWVKVEDDTETTVLGTETHNKSILSSVPVGEKIYIEIEYRTKGSFYVVVDVDPEDVIDEINEFNNRMVGDRQDPIPRLRPDLSVSPADITFEPEDVMAGQDTTIKAKIHNDGKAPAFGVVVYFYVNDTFINDAYIDEIGEKESRFASVLWIPAEKGRYKISVVVDPDKNIDEDEEGNNDAFIEIDVEAYLPDFSIDNEEISLDRETIYTDQDVTITAKIHNIGTANFTGNVTIRFIIKLGEDVTVDENVTLQNLTLDASKDVSIIWKPKVEGTYTIYIEIDPEEEILEIDEENNDATLDGIEVLKLIVDFEPIKITFSPLAPKIGDLVTITVKVHNWGETGAENVKVTLYLNNAPLGNKTITFTKGDENKTTSFQWSTEGLEAGVYNFTVYVDIDNEFSETDETNNQLSADITLYEPQQPKKEKEGLDETIIYIIIAVVVIAVVVGGVGFWWWKRQ